MVVSTPFLWNLANSALQNRSDVVAFYNNYLSNSGCSFNKDPFTLKSFQLLIHVECQVGFSAYSSNLIKKMGLS